VQGVIGGHVDALALVGEGFRQDLDVGVSA
jgi:hypothetical protein